MTLDCSSFYNLYGYLTKTINYLDHYKIHFQLLIYKLKTKRKLKLKNWIGFFVLFLLANWWPKFYHIVKETREVPKCACSITRSAENWQIIKFLFKYFLNSFFCFDQNMIFNCSFSGNIDVVNSKYKIPNCNSLVVSWHKFAFKFR